MRSITKILFLLLLLTSSPVLPLLAGGVNSDKLLWEANQLFRDFKDAEALEKFEAVLLNDAGHLEALCKASILCGRIGNRFTDDTSKDLYFKKGFSYAEKAYTVSNSNADANYVMALSLSYLGQTASLKERMVQMIQIKGFLDNALVFDAEHAGAWHLLGRWAYKVANFSFAERAAGKLFNLIELPSASNEQAIAAFTKSIALDPTNLLYYYDLARVQKEMEHKNECIITLQKALDQKLITTEDLELSRRCKLLLKEIMKIS